MAWWLWWNQKTWCWAALPMLSLGVLLFNLLQTFAGIRHTIASYTATIAMRLSPDITTQSLSWSYSLKWSSSDKIQVNDITYNILVLTLDAITLQLDTVPRLGPTMCTCHATPPENHEYWALRRQERQRRSLNFRLWTRPTTAYGCVSLDPRLSFFIAYLSCVCRVAQNTEG